MSTRLLIAALLLAAFAAGLRADRILPDASDTVRYVSVNRCLREMPGFEKDMRAIQERYQAEGERLQQVADALRAREAELAQLDPQSAEYQLGQMRVKAEQEATAREAQFLAQNQGREMDTLLDATVRRIHGAAAQLGEREGFGAVMMKPGSFIDLEKGSVSDSLDDLETRWVMWSHPDFDVTAQVLAILAEGQ